MGPKGCNSTSVFQTGLGLWTDSSSNQILKLFITHTYTHIHSHTGGLNLAGQLYLWDFKSKILHIHLEILPSELFVAGRNMSKCPLRRKKRYCCKRGLIVTKTGSKCQLVNGDGNVEDAARVAVWSEVGHVSSLKDKQRVALEAFVSGNTFSLCYQS